MKIAFFSTTKTDQRLFTPLAKARGIEMTFLDVHLNDNTVRLADGYDGICVFVNDQLPASVLQTLHQMGIGLITLRCAGFNNVDLAEADRLGMTVLRVPAYSPMAVAEHALALMMSLNRKTYRAYNRVRDSNFALEGLLGFDMFNKTAGVIGTGKIGMEMVRILSGLGMMVLAYDPFPNEEAKNFGAEYVDLETLYEKSDVISLHVPLLNETTHMINTDSIAKMKRGVMLINTSRGALMDAKAVITGLKSQQIGYLGMDVYEQEANLFFEDHSEEIIQDDVFERLLTFPNVLVTAHQAFFTQEALDHITDTTLQNVLDFNAGTPNSQNCVSCQHS